MPSAAPAAPGRRLGASPRVAQLGLLSRVVGGMVQVGWFVTTASCLRRARMKVIGLLNGVFKSERGYVQVEIEGLRLDAGKVDEERLQRWRALLDQEVVAVVSVQFRQTKDGRAWASRRLVGLYPSNGRS